MQKFQDQAEIISLPCPGLVEFVERGELSGEALEHFLKNLFAPYQERNPVDAVVLGCTHYPFVRETIQKLLEPECRSLTAERGPPGSFIN